MTDDTEDRYHYALVRRAIEALDAAGGANVSLEALAGEVNLSPAHFQRVFSRWAGVSPKKLQHYLALGHAKALLATNNRCPVLVRHPQHIFLYLYTTPPFVNHHPK